MSDLVADLLHIAMGTAPVVLPRSVSTFEGRDGDATFEVVEEEVVRRPVERAAGPATSPTRPPEAAAAPAPRHGIEPEAVPETARSPVAEPPARGVPDPAPAPVVSAKVEPPPVLPEVRIDRGEALPMPALREMVPPPVVVAAAQTVSTRGEVAPPEVQREIETAETVRSETEVQERIITQRVVRDLTQWVRQFSREVHETVRSEAPKEEEREREPVEAAARPGNAPTSVAPDVTVFHELTTVLSPMEPPARESQGPAPVQVTIGRVEVRVAPPPSRPAPRPAAPSRPTPSLDDFLSKRRGR